MFDGLRRFHHMSKNLTFPTISEILRVEYHIVCLLLNVLRDNPLTGKYVNLHNGFSPNGYPKVLMHISSTSAKLTSGVLCITLTFGFHSRRWPLLQLIGLIKVVRHIRVSKVCHSNTLYLFAQGESFS